MSLHTKFFFWFKGLQNCHLKLISTSIGKIEKVISKEAEETVNHASEFETLQDKGKVPTLSVINALRQCLQQNKINKTRKAI